jgi:cell wall-associated NlpC family hydrolase
MPHRRRRRYRSRHRVPARFAVSAVAAGTGLAALAGHLPPGAAAAASSAPGKTPTAVIAYARQQIGQPYLWGGTGPGGFDCSGLAVMAYRAAGITIPRTSQDQWARGPQVSTPEPGDLVFFAGADGTTASPGHVGLVVDPAKHLMVDAYDRDAPVRYDTYGLPGSAEGLTDPVGFTDPAGGA